MTDVSVLKNFLSQLCLSFISPTSRFVFVSAPLSGKGQLEIKSKQEGELATWPLAITGKELQLYVPLRSCRLSKGWFDARTGGCWYKGSFSKIADPRLLFLC